MTAPDIYGRNDEQHEQVEYDVPSQNAQKSFHIQPGDFHLRKQFCTISLHVPTTQ
jgi:hypothetical protein